MIFIKMMMIHGCEWFAVVLYDDEIASPFLSIIIHTHPRYAFLDPFVRRVTGRRESRPHQEANQDLFAEGVQENHRGESRRERCGGVPEGAPFLRQHGQSVPRSKVHVVFHIWYLTLLFLLI